MAIQVLERAVWSVDEYLKMIRQIPRTGNSNFLTYSHG